MATQSPRLLCSEVRQVVTKKKYCGSFGEAFLRESWLTHSAPLLPFSVPPCPAPARDSRNIILDLKGPGLHPRNGRTESWKEQRSRGLWGAELLHMPCTANLWAFTKERKINFCLEFPVIFSAHLNLHQQRLLQEELGLGPGPSNSGACCNYYVYCLIVLFILATLRCPISTRNC